MPAAVISRQEAKKQGLTRYYTGKPCKHRHVAIRWTANGICDDCLRETRHRRYQADLEGSREIIRRWRTNNPEKMREAVRRWQRANPEQAKAATKRWIAAHPEKNRETVRKHYKKDRARNPEKYLAQRARRRALKNGATVLLATKREAEIRAAATHCYHCRKRFYKGQVTHLDHLVALSRGGQHSETNIVVSCASCNLRKNATAFNPSTGQGILL